MEISEYGETANQQISRVGFYSGSSSLGIDIAYNNPMVHVWLHACAHHLKDKTVKPLIILRALISGGAIDNIYDLFAIRKRLTWLLRVDTRN